MTRRRALIAVLLAGSLTLGGCAGSADLHRDTASELQSLVVAAANQAAAGKPTEALAILDSLQVRVTESASRGGMSSDRLARIQQAVDAVRADLQPTPVQPEVTAPEPAPEESPAPTVEAPQAPAENPGNGNGNKDKDKGKDKK